MEASKADREKAYAKITRDLKIIGVRSDGMHDIQAEIVTIDLADDLVIIEGQDGIEIKGPYKTQLRKTPIESNLITRALKLISKKAKVILEKNIPVGAGLGGGSSDAAAILRWANVKDLNVAAKIGADVPFCLVGGRAYVSGIGDILHPLEFKDLELTLFLLPFGIDTRAVYLAYDEGYKADGPNQLMEAACKVEPRLKQWINYLKSQFGEIPLLAGSGSTLFYESSKESLGLDRSTIFKTPVGVARIINAKTVPSYPIIDNDK